MAELHHHSGKLMDDLKSVPTVVWWGGAAAAALIFILKRNAGTAAPAPAAVDTGSAGAGSGSTDSGGSTGNSGGTMDTSAFQAELDAILAALSNMPNPNPTPGGTGGTGGTDTGVQVAQLYQTDPNAAQNLFNNAPLANAPVTNPYTDGVVGVIPYQRTVPFGQLPTAPQVAMQHNVPLFYQGQAAPFNPAAPGAQAGHGSFMQAGGPEAINRPQYATLSPEAVSRPAYVSPEATGSPYYNPPEAVSRPAYIITNPLVPGGREEVVKSKFIPSVPRRRPPQRAPSGSGGGSGGRGQKLME